MAGFGVGWLGGAWVLGWDTFEGQAGAWRSREGEHVRMVGADSGVLSQGERVRGFVGLLEKRGDDGSEAQAADAALVKMDAEDFAASAKEVMAVLLEMGKKGRISDALAEAWMDRWLELDAEAARKFVVTERVFEKLDPEGSGSWEEDYVGVFAFRGVVQALARREPDWTMNQVSAQEAGAKRDLAVNVLLKQVARLDPVKAKQFLARFADGPNRVAAVEGLVKGLAEVDYRASFEVALKEPAGPLRDNLLHAPMERAARNGTAAIRELLDRIDSPELRGDLAAQALSNFSHYSREDPTEWAKAETERMKGPIDGFWKGGVGQLVGRRGGDPPALAEWALGLSNDSERVLFTSMALRWVRQDPAGMRNWLDASVGKLDAQTIARCGPMMGTMASRDLAATRQWAEGLPPGPLADHARFQVALQSGREGEIEHARVAYQAIAASDRNGHFARGLAHILAGKDGGAAAQWAIELPTGPGRAAALSTVAGEWSYADPRGAAQWLETLPPGADRDLMVQQYAGKVALADPQAAAEWVRQIEDPKAREKAAADVFRPWNKEDPIASRKWIRTLPGVSEKWRANYFDEAP
jgi:hypothetical protein